MRIVMDHLKTAVGSILVVLGAALMAAVVPVVCLLLMAGPLLAIAGLIAGCCLSVTVAAIVFVGPPTAMAGGLAVSAVVRDLAGSCTNAPTQPPPREISRGHNGIPD